MEKANKEDKEELRKLKERLNALEAENAKLTEEVNKRVKMDDVVEVNPSFFSRPITFEKRVPNYNTIPFQRESMHINGLPPSINLSKVREVKFSDSDEFINYEASRVRSSFDKPSDGKYLFGAPTDYLSFTHPTGLDTTKGILAGDFYTSLMRDSVTSTFGSAATSIIDSVSFISMIIFL